MIHVINMNPFEQLWTPKVQVESKKLNSNQFIYKNLKSS